MNPKNFRKPSSDGLVPRLRLRFLPAWALMAVTAAMLGGCQLLPPATADATRFFVLSGPVLAETTTTAEHGHLQLGLRQVELPDYLRTTKSMVVRAGANEIRYQDYARWAEPLEAGVNRVLKNCLLAVPEVRGVDAHPMRGDVARDYDIAVRIIRCEGVVLADGGNGARFEATYKLTTTDGSGRQIASGVYQSPPASWDGKDFSALAQLLSDAVTGLGEKIATDLPK